MSRNRVLSVAVAAMTAAVAVAAVPAQAKNIVLKERQVRALIKQEVSKAIKGLRGPNGDAGPPGATGPQGIAGPAGMDGSTSLFAYIDIFGRVDPSRSVGITEENLRVENVRLEGAQSPDPEGRLVIATTYCFIGLPPIMGGQVTMDGLAGYAAVVSPKLTIDPVSGPPDCPVRVSIHGFEQFPDDHREPPIADPFYVLLY